MTNRVAYSRTFGGRFLAWLAIAVILAATACQAAPSPTGGAGREPVAFDVPATAFNSNSSYFPFVVAKAKGFFEAEGLRPNFINVGGGGEALRAFTASDAPIGVIGVPSALPAIQAGEQFRIVGQTSRLSDTWLATKASSSIKTPKDFAGKKVGVTRQGSTLEQIAIAAAAGAGLTTKDFQLINLGTVPELVLALDQGLVDAIAGAGRDAIIQHTVLAKDWRLLGSGSDFAPVIDAVIVAKGPTIADRPQLIKGFVAAIRKAIKFIGDNPNSDELVDIWAQWQSRTDAAQRPLVAATVKDLAGHAGEFWGDLSVDVSKTQAIAADLVKQQALPKAPTDLSGFVDQQFTK